MGKFSSKFEKLYTLLESDIWGEHYKYIGNRNPTVSDILDYRGEIGELLDNAFIVDVYEEKNGLKTVVVSIEPNYRELSDAEYDLIIDLVKENEEEILARYDADALEINIYK